MSLRKITAATLLALIYNSSVLAQTVSTAMLRVFDANGRAIGRFMDGTQQGYPYAVVNFPDGEAVAYTISEEGISDGTRGGSGGVSWIYTSANCTGTRYMEAQTGMLNVGYFDAWPKKAQPGYSLSGWLYYTKAPYQNITPKSYLNTWDGAGCHTFDAPQQPRRVGTIGVGGYVSGIKLPLKIR